MDDGVAAAPPPAAAAAAAAVLGIISLVWIGAGMLPRSFIVVGCVLAVYLSLITSLSVLIVIEAELST